jgi:hypothetical protein
MSLATNLVSFVSQCTVDHLAFNSFLDSHMPAMMGGVSLARPVFRLGEMNS